MPPAKTLYLSEIEIREIRRVVPLIDFYICSPIYIVEIITISLSGEKLCYCVCANRILFYRFSYRSTPHVYIICLKAIQYIEFYAD